MAALQRWTQLAPAWLLLCQCYPAARLVSRPSVLERARRQIAAWTELEPSRAAQGCRTAFDEQHSMLYLGLIAGSSKSVPLRIPAP